MDTLVEFCVDSLTVLIRPMYTVAMVDLECEYVRARARVCVCVCTH